MTHEQTPVTPQEEEEWQRLEAANLREYYVTFGSQYAYEPHPSAPWAHPDGYWTIVAKDMEQAREYVFECIAGRFAFMYDERPNAAHFPMGELRRSKASNM